VGLGGERGGRMTSVLAFDPGKTTGWARFFSTGKLRDAGAIGFQLLREKMAMEGYFGSLEVAVIEVPRWYPREHKIDVNDLIDLAVMVGEIRAHFEDVELVFPRTWKGTVPKAIHNRRVLAALIDEERALLPRRPRAKDYDHNMVDAVGIGLWKLGRLS